MARKKVVDTDALLALNPEYAQALMRGEKWALDHMSLCESLNRGEPEGFRRPFDGTPRKWCGAACPFDEGCVTCALPENPEMARSNREHKRHMRDGVIAIEGDVNEKMTACVREMLEVAARKRMDTLEFMFRCNGGDVREGMTIFDLIRNAPVKKRVGVVEYAHSMGAIILQACDWREALPSARMLMHHTRFHEVTVEMLKNRMVVDLMVDMAKPNEDRMRQILVARTKRSAEEIRRLCDKEKYLSAQEALEFGLIDAIRKV